MRHFFTLLACAVISLTAASAQSFDDTFKDATLRIDYIFAGNATQQIIAVDEFARFDAWAGRRVNLDSVPVRGNGEVKLIDAESGATLYRNSFSSLFQEWLSTDEAKTEVKSFEFTQLVPMPKKAAIVETTLFNNKGEVQASARHKINPDDKLIRDLNSRAATPHEYLLKSGSSQECIDIVIMAEGYTAEEMDVFMRDAQTAYEEIVSYEPFSSHKQRFNFIAVKAASKQSDVSVPQNGEWKQTAVNSNFMTFYSPRYLTTNSVHLIHDNLTGIPTPSQQPTTPISSLSWYTNSGIRSELWLMNISTTHLTSTPRVSTR